MSKAKKSAKSAKIPQPIKIKKEKTEEDRAIHSMTHYVDDRLELVKQIFGSLKTKTITNLAPEYLKAKEMNDIQELCLNELLCLSKKRLLSIINATKCPTDTESSEDTDVEAKEEHISLEEISSDSEIESGGAKVTKKSATQSRTKKNSKKLNQANDKETGGGQISVLELLELQARARAIRSQLALEPVTKIEVDSDEENIAMANDSSTTKDQKNLHKRKKPNGETSTEKQNSDKSSLRLSTSLNDEVAKETNNGSSNGQKIKLKRNFRKQIIESPEGNRLQAEQTINQDTPKALKKEKLSRSPSPDVIPIEAEPETLCIIDSSSDTEEVKQKPTATEKPQVLENIEIVKPVEAAIPGKTVQEAAAAVADEAEEEAEDGEIIESETEHNTKEEILMSNRQVELANNSLPSVSSESAPKNGGVSCTSEQQFAFNQNDSMSASESAIATKANEDLIMLSPVHIHDSDGDQSDDVISIEGGDLENEMSEHLDDETSNAIKTPTSDIEGEGNESNDIIALDSSEDEDVITQQHNSESWQSRYLKSSKVNKVLAVSRLGKRVRDKLRTSKLSNKEAADEFAKEDKIDKSFTSKHEEGSVEQYKELLEHSAKAKM